MSKSLIILVKSFLGNFYRLLAIFYWSHWLFWQLKNAEHRYCAQLGFEPVAAEWLSLMHPLDYGNPLMTKYSNPLSSSEWKVSKIPRYFKVSYDAEPFNQIMSVKNCQWLLHCCQSGRLRYNKSVAFIIPSYHLSMDPQQCIKINQGPIIYRNFNINLCYAHFKCSG